MDACDPDYPLHTGEVQLVVRDGQGSVDQTAEWTDVHHVLDCRRTRKEEV